MANQRHSSVLQKIADTDDRVAEYEFSIDDQPHWLHLAPGWKEELMGTHTIHEDTVAECLSQYRAITRCDCDHCRDA